MGLRYRIVGVNVADEVVARSAARNTPARATVETRLASPDYKVEIMVAAARYLCRSVQQVRESISRRFHAAFG
jgi:hypothetical protein